MLLCGVLLYVFRDVPYVLWVLMLICCVVVLGDGYMLLYVVLSRYGVLTTLTLAWTLTLALTVLALTLIWDRIVLWVYVGLCLCLVLVFS